MKSFGERRREILERQVVDERHTARQGGRETEDDRQDDYDKGQGVEGGLSQRRRPKHGRLEIVLE